MGLMFQPFMKYVDFQGRARRSEYWLWALFIFVVNAVLTVIQFSMMGGAAMTMSATHSDAHAMQAAGGLMMIGLVKMVFFLGILLPSIAVAVRRMHDTNRTGWWILFPTAVSIIALVVYISVDGANFMNQMKGLQGLQGNSNPAAAIAVLSALFKPLFWVIVPSFLAKVVTFVFRVLDGTPGNNRFGPDPKGRGANASKVF